MKGESAGYFDAGGDAKRKGPFTVDPCNILIPGDSLSRGGPGPPTLTENDPEWVVSTEDSFKLSTS